MTKQTFQLLTPDEMTEIAKQTRSVEGEHFLPHLYGNAIQMAVLKKNDIQPETLPLTKDWFYVPDFWGIESIPNLCHKDKFIEIEYRDGMRYKGYAREWEAEWRQDGLRGDIVRYRIL